MVNMAKSTFFFGLILPTFGFDPQNRLGHLLMPK